MTDIAAINTDVAISVQKQSQDLAQSQIALLLSGMSPSSTAGSTDSAAFSANALAQLDQSNS